MLTEHGAWQNYPVCTFKHRNLYNKKDYTFEGYVLGEVVTNDFKQYKILTYDGKYWHKHKILDEVKIIKEGYMDDWLEGTVKKGISSNQR